MNQAPNPAQSTLICVLSIFKRQIELFYAQNWKSIIIKINESQTFLFITPRAERGGGLKENGQNPDSRSKNNENQNNDAVS